jgi:hypothetical protein
MDETKIYTWAELNKKLRKVTSEFEVQHMITEEQANGGRTRWIHRMYARYGVLRKKRERREMKIA